MATNQMFKDLPVLRILKQISRLNLIAGNSSNAYKLGPQVKKVELILQEKNVYGPAAGLKKFWRKHLPTLKFHNYDTDISMTRVRSKPEEAAKVPAKIVVYDEAGQKQELDCKNLDESVILQKLVKLTQATPVPEADIPHWSTKKIVTYD